jgi:hypothetical protein
MGKDIPYRNKTPYGWWVASYIERQEWLDSSPTSDRSRCIAWENTIILQAPDREAAYQKAIDIGSLSNGTTFQNEDGTRNGRWVFEGLTSLLPIYDKLEDGAEILWQEHDGKTMGKIKSYIKQKHELEVFEDDNT